MIDHACIGYVIRKEYEGGGFYILIREGYVSDISSPILIYDTYTSRRSAQAVATRYKKSDDLSRRLHEIVPIADYKPVLLINGRLVD